MGGPPCWKQIIDQWNALTQVTNCMAETVRIAGLQGHYPTDEEEDKFIAAANELSRVVQGIQKRLAAEIGL